MRLRLAAGCAVALLVVPLPPPEARAVEYEMETVVRYAVDPAAGEIAVTARVTFTNTLPNPPGQVSGFDHIDLAIQAGASEVAAQDEDGSLAVDLQPSEGALVASVTTRSRVRYNRTVSFTLSYVLTDGSAPNVHVRPRVVKFAAWGFGSSSQVTVAIPAGFEVRADGDPMLTSTDGGQVLLMSGPIAEPNRWLAVVSAVGPGEYVTSSASVALASGTVDLQVRGWSDDPDWAAQTMALLIAALPMLEEAIGLAYPRVGPLRVVEAAGGEASTGELPSTGAEVEVAFDASGFTLLHQAAHVWIGDGLATDRWIREGLASHYAGRVAEQLGIEPPYDPVVRAGELAADARPLVDWGVGQGATADRYGYAASWAFANLVAGAVGDAHLAQALRRIVAGVPAYDTLAPDAVGADGLPFASVDTRRLLDQLAAVGTVDLGDPFVDVALGPDAALEMAERAFARDAYRSLLGAAGDWGVPDPIRAEMAAWRFDEARAEIAEAADWLVERDVLIARVASAGLVPPDRLRQRFASGGGGPDARAELAAEGAVVAAYVEVRERARGASGLLDRVGLFGGPHPEQLLSEAGTSFGSGDLQEAVAALDRLNLQLDQAPTTGALRLASAGLLLALIGLGTVVAVRRSQGSHYTAGP